MRERRAGRLRLNCGDAAEVVDAAGAGPLLVSASRSVIYASSGNDFAQAAREAAIELRTDLGPNS